MHALREAQADMEERHTAEVIELKKSQLDAVKMTVQHQEEDGIVDAKDEEHLMLANLVKVKDEEIRQLKRQLGVVELPESDARVSPLRASAGSAGGKANSRTMSYDRKMA